MAIAERAQVRGVRDRLQHGWCLVQRALRRGERTHFTSTSPTSLVRLLASTGFPSRATSILRTMSPPPGITQLWNFSVAGSKRTMVLGLAPEFLRRFQMTELSEKERIVGNLQSPADEQRPRLEPGSE